MTDLIVDANSLYARAWYATLKQEPGAALRASLGTVLSLLNVNNDKLGERVDRLFFGWDGVGGRDKHREAKPNAYYETMELFVDWLGLMFKPAQAIHPVYEADDLVATAAFQSKADTIFIVSGDKDLQQLAGKRVHYYSLNEKMILSHRAIRDKWHVKHPSQVAIALAIIGDKADLIAGIKGWGPKRVQKLFEAVTPEMNFEQALDAVVAQIPEKLQEGFWRDLDLTLLNQSVENVPQPKPIVPAPLEVVEELKMPELVGAYRSFYHRYTSQRGDVNGDVEEVPDEK
jgi:5'-3' exonuclease